MIEQMTNFGTGGGTNLLRRRMLIQPIRQPVIESTISRFMNLI